MDYHVKLYWRYLICYKLYIAVGRIYDDSYWES